MRTHPTSSPPKALLVFGYSALILSVSVILILLLYVAKRHHVQRLIHVAHERLMSGTEESAAAALTELKPRVLGLSRKQYLNFLAGTACNPFDHPIPRRAACADLIRAAPGAGIILVTSVALALTVITIVVIVIIKKRK